MWHRHISSSSPKYPVIMDIKNGVPFLRNVQAHSSQVVCTEMIPTCHSLRSLLYHRLNLQPTNCYSGVVIWTNNLI